MPAKSILKKTLATAEVADAKAEETNIILGDIDESLEQDGGGVSGKKTQIKKKESSTSASTVSKPVSKIIKKVSITQQPEESITHDEPLSKVRTEPRLEYKEKEKEKEKDKEILVDINKAIKATKKLSKKQDISEIYNDDDVDYRYIITSYDFSKNKTLPKITKYEKALLVGKRAKQIEEGANPNVKVLPGQTSIDIAEEELRQRKIPFIIKRPIGNKFEYWKPVDMEVVMD